MLPFDPKKPLYSFEMRALHAKRRIHLFVDERFTYFRARNAPDDWLGTFIDEFRLWKQLADYQSLFRVRKRASNLISKRKFFRVFWLPDPRPGERRIWQILWHPELTYVTPKERSEDLQGAFCSPRKLQNRINLWNAPTQVIQKHFEKEWRDPNSDVRAALPYCELAPTGFERKWRSIKWLRGGRHELEAVLRAAHASETNWPKESTLFITVAFLASEQPTIVRRAFRPYLFWEIDPQERLARITERLCERNYGIYNLPSGDRTDWSRNWKRGKLPSSFYQQTNIGLIIEPPTQHERLEASLFLRGWLRDNAPDLLPDWFPDASL